MSFTQFGQTIGLAPGLLRAATDLGWTVPTPVQVDAMPAVLRGQDVQVQAQTGSGKTGAFALPVLQALQGLQTQMPHAPRRVRTLVLVPTRELAAQVGEVFRSLSQHLTVPIKIAVVFGGVSINPQMMGLRGGADVVVATPGRLLDLVEHNALKLGAVSTLVLDEADRLLDLGFAEELGRILALLPAQRQNLLFSATFDDGVQALADKLLRDPIKIEVAPAPATDAVILQRAIAVDTPKRTQLLRHLFKTQGWTRVLVFVATKHAAEIVSEKLYKAGIFATPFHGELSQGARQQVLEEFKADRWEVVVTTDLASRGIDIAQLPVVVNYDLPRSATDYLHRIGRTGRAGHSGEAVSFITADSEAHFRLIEKRQGLSLPREQIEGFESTEVAVPVLNAPAGNETARGNGGVKGLRPSKKDKLRAAGKLPPLAT